MEGWEWGSSVSWLTDEPHSFPPQGLLGGLEVEQALAQVVLSYTLLPLGQLENLFSLLGSEQIIHLFTSDTCVVSAPILCKCQPPALPAQTVPGQ